MGMRDESWCADCGKSQPYSPDEVTCGACATEQSDMQSNKLIEYMKIHLISLEQDSERIQEEMSQFEYNMDSKDYQSLEIEDISLNGQIIATRHLLSVATDIMNSYNEREYV